MRVFITREISEAGLRLLKEANIEYDQYTEKRNLPQDELIRICLKYDGLLSAGPNNFDEYFFQQCSHLKGIALHSVGYDNVDITAATKHGIAVGNTPGVLSNATADIAFLLMLAVSRKAFYLHKQIAKGEWGFFEPTANLGIELNGKTLGVLGLGQIGLELARKSAAAYNMKIIYHNRSKNEQAEKQLGAQYVSFEELLMQSDVLSVHANLSEETKGLFNKAAFQKMKPSAIFINTARGSIHQEQDLTEALQEGIIWGAGLDVTSPEPMAPDNPLLSMPNVCVLPHIGSATEESRSAMACLAAQNIIAALQGKHMPHVVNPEVYSRSENLT